MGKRKADRIRAAVEKILAFRGRLREEQEPSVNPLKAFRDLSGLEVSRFSRAVGISLSRYYSIEAGNVESLPQGILVLAEGLLGAGASGELEEAWVRFKKALATEARIAILGKMMPRPGESRIPEDWGGGMTKPPSDPNPCVALRCSRQEEPVSGCRDHFCPYCWLRESREDRAARESKDLAAGAARLNPVDGCHG